MSSKLIIGFNCKS